MTEMVGCREIRQALGVYVLGAIDPAERAQVDDHLGICPECREELASLAGLPALLRRIPPDEAERLAMADAGDQFDDYPSEELLSSLLARTASVRRARRWRGLAAAAAVVVLALGGGAAVTNALQGHSGGQAVAEHWHKVTVVDPRTGAHLTVKYTPMTWGTMMDVQVSGIEPGIVCQFQVTDSSGHRWTVGGWTASVHRHSSPWYPASTSVRDENLRSFEVTSGHQVLAVAPADSGES
jgi:Putative zinc-finger